MKLHILLFLTITYFTSSIHTQGIDLIDNDGFASRFIARIHHRAIARGSFIANGIFFNSRSVVTLASAIHGLNATHLRVDFGNTNIIGSQSAHPESIIVHPSFNIDNPMENNLAVLRLSAADGNRTAPTIEIRNFGSLVRSSQHFCSMFGFSEIFSDRWQGLEPMQIIPALIQQNSTFCNFLFRGDFTCTFGTAGSRERCGGFVGSPLICDGERIAGMVVRDNYCGHHPTAYVMEMQRHNEWVRRVSGGSKMSVSVLVGLLAILVHKLRFFISY